MIFAASMNYLDLKIVFMGTPEFAVASLDALGNAGCNIVGVITAPDKPAGRGLKLQESPVKKYAVEKGLNVLQPEKLKNPQFLNRSSNKKASQCCKAFCGPDGTRTSDLRRDRAAF